MRTITVTYGAEDAWEFAQAHLSPIAWTAIDEALMHIRNHFKHDVLGPDQCLIEVRKILTEAKAKLDE